MKGKKEVEDKLSELNHLIEENRYSYKCDDLSIDELEELGESLLRLKLRRSVIDWVLN